MQVATGRTVNQGFRNEIFLGSGGRGKANLHSPLDTCLACFAFGDPDHCEGGLNGDAKLHMFWTAAAGDGYR